MTDLDAHIEGLLNALSLEQKVRLLTGADSWSLHGIDSIGLRPLVVSDGPAGVRGATWDERDPSVSFPSPTAISASWDPGMVEQVGLALGAEARRKGVQVILAPTINIQRSPYGGRHFETFSEDAVLTASTATAYVRGIQRHGVGATLKHYVANDAETERFTASSDVAERPLREIYLAAFEGPVADGPAWLVMSSYNRINGTTASEHPLLRSPLKDEWGFDGVVVSDWTAVRSLESARHGQDLVMPGPDGPWGDALVDAVRSGDIPEDTVDDKVRRILRLAARVGALESLGEPERVALEPAEAAVDTARRAAVAGSVLLANDGLLPLGSPASIAVIGEGAVQARTQGGGSATVIPASITSPLEGISARWPQAQVSWSRGAVVQSGLSQIAVDRLRAPGGEPGMRVRYLAADGAVLDEEVRAASRIVSFDAESKALRAATVELAFTYAPESVGDTTPLGIEGLSDYRVVVDGVTAASGSLRTRPEDDPATAVLNPPFVRLDVPVSGESMDVVVELSPVEGGIPDALALGVGLPPSEEDADALVAAAIEAARASEVAIVVVSTSDEVESEGFDRTSLALPGDQDRLVREVVAANPRTIVVVNSGSPVLLPWKDDAAAVLATWFPGQEFGTALADVLSGDAEPGGRLPVTWPADEESVPVSNVTPTAGHLSYEEGIHVGHRAWLRSGARPAFSFGHGLGYTTWDVDDVRVDGGGQDDATVTATVRNTGARDGKVVLQAYLEVDGASIDMPVRWFAGHAVAHVAAGESMEITIDVPRRRFMAWEGAWTPVEGTFTVRVGLSSEDLRAAAVIGAEAHAEAVLDA